MLAGNVELQAGLTQWVELLKRDFGVLLATSLSAMPSIGVGPANLWAEEEHMSKVVRCRDVGVDCDYEARGETDVEVLRKCAEHARSEHGMEKIPAELAAKIKTAIRDEKAAA